MKNVVRLFILVALAASCSLDFGSLQGGIPDSGTAGAGGQAGTSASTVSTGGSTGGAGNVGPFGGTTTGGTTASSVPTAGKPSYDAEPPSVPDAPPVDPNETFTCSPGTVRIHVRDIWSIAANPTMGTMTTAPLSVLVIYPTGSWPSYGARQDTANCSWYSVCAPNTLTRFEIKPVGADACGGTSNASGTFDASSLIPTTNEIWLDYTGPSSSVAADYQTATVGTQHFRLTSDETALGTEACPQGQPDQTLPSGYIKVHFRYPWADPQETGFAGSACAKSKLGYDVPPYPTSLKVTGLACEMQALLEFQDGQCPWYYVLIPTKDWTSTANITFRYPDDSLGLWTPNLPLPALTPGVTEYWIGYAGAPDSTAVSIPTCMDGSQDPLSSFFYTANPGPGYANCGGST